MVKLLLFGFAIYFLTRLVGGLIKPSHSTVEIHGESKNNPLDLTNVDVEDVPFKEVKKQSGK